MMKDFKKYSNLEEYLFTEVKESFVRRRFLTSEEFFCIVIWKANRSKSKIKNRLLNLFRSRDIDSAVKGLTSELFKRKTPKERLSYLFSDCSFRLPMASAILTVLFPEEFTVYDVRVCDMLGDYHNLQNKTNFDNLWKGYEEFKEAVIEAVPHERILRNKDLWLWGKSFHEDLVKFLRR